MFWISFCIYMGSLVSDVDSNSNSLQDRYKKYWWGYEGVEGPEFWGTLVNEFKLCSDGKQQSPIDIQPSLLLFDPNLKHLKLDIAGVNGKLYNNRRDITFQFDPEYTSHINVSEGPLSYTYRMTSIKFHFSKCRHDPSNGGCRPDDGGSEHRIAGHAFPAEMQIFGFNSDLYENMSKAENSSNGIVIISTFLEVQLQDNKAFSIFTDNLEALSNIKGGDDLVNPNAQIYNLMVADLLPKTDHYITYEGSMTQPSCHETVTWIIFNKPSYLSASQLKAIREVPMEWNQNNSRPPRHLNHRVVRTNINKGVESRLCSMKRDLFYEVNLNFRT